MSSYRADTHHGCWHNVPLLWYLTAQVTEIPATQARMMMAGIWNSCILESKILCWKGVGMGQDVYIIETSITEQAVRKTMPVEWEEGSVGKVLAVQTW